MDARSGSVEGGNESGGEGMRHILFVHYLIVPYGWGLQNAIMDYLYFFLWHVLNICLRTSSQFRFAAADSRNGRPTVFWQSARCAYRSSAWRSGGKGTTWWRSNPQWHAELVATICHLHVFFDTTRDNFMPDPYSSLQGMVVALKQTGGTIPLDRVSCTHMIWLMCIPWHMVTLMFV